MSQHGIEWIPGRMYNTEGQYAIDEVPGVLHGHTRCGSEGVNHQRDNDEDGSCEIILTGEELEGLAFRYLRGLMFAHEIYLGTGPQGEPRTNEWPWLPVLPETQINGTTAQSTGS